MKRNLELMAALLKEAENSCGRVAVDPNEVASIMLLQDIGCVEATFKNAPSGVPNEAMITRVTNRGHIELAKMERDKKNAIDGSSATKIRIIEDKSEKIRDGLVATRDKEIERYETVMYSVASGCITFALGIGGFCYANDISLVFLKWLLLAVFCCSGFAIIGLLVSGKASVLSRELGVEKMDTSDTARKNECARKSAKWDDRTELWDKIALWAFSAGVVLTMATLIALIIIMPPNKPTKDNEERHMPETTGIPPTVVPWKIAEDGKPLLPRETAEIQKPVQTNDNSVVVLDSKDGK